MVRRSKEAQVIEIVKGKRLDVATVVTVKRSGANGMGTGKRKSYLGLSR